MREQIDIDELRHDTEGYRSNVVPDVVESIFDYADLVVELEPEDLKRPGKRVKRGGFEVYVTDEEE
jgi:hypothetical protein